MKRLTGLLFSVAAVALVGCGDNSKECGSGTTDEDGVCVGTGGSGSGGACGEGTHLDDTTDTCVVNDDLCQNGTVFIGGQCVDPTAGLTVDVTEAAEPNGLGIFGEPSTEPAGQVELKAIGGVTVVQGNLNPHPDADDDGNADPDFDTYLLEVDSPTVLEISVDGVGGIEGGFGMVGDPGDGQLDDYIRFGVSVDGDTSKRQLYVPKAGLYAIVVADSRTVRDGDAPGNATDKYYMSIEQKALPTAVSISLTNGVGQANGTITDGEVDAFSANLGDGFADAQLESFDDGFTGELIYTVGDSLRALSDEAHGDPDDPAFVLGGATSGQTPLFIVDHVVNTSDAAVDYRVTLHAATTAALPANGTITQQNPAAADFHQTGYNYLSFDATSDDQLFGVDLSFSEDVTAEIWDQDGFELESFTDLSSGDTFTDYKGVIRVPRAGRWYIVYYSPTAADGDDIVVTSKVAPVTAQTLTYNTPQAAVAKGAYNSVVFDYAVGDEPWQLITLGANTASGGATVRFFNPADSYGTLNDVNGTPPDQDTLIDFGSAANSTATQGIVAPLVDPTHYIVVVSTDSDAGTFDLETEKRVYTDEGTHSAPFTHTDTAVAFPKQAVTNIPTDSVRFLIKTDPRSLVTVSATPTALQGVTLSRLSYDEQALSSATGTGTAATLSNLVAPAEGYLAFEVASSTLAIGTFNLTITIAAPPAPTPSTYTLATSSATWMNVCGVSGAKDITPDVDNRTDSYTADQTIPAFSFYATAETTLKVSTNGFLTFDTTADPATAAFAFTEMPSADVPDKTIAPYYTSLVNTRICRLDSGSSITFQWRGQNDFSGDWVGFQVVLNTVDNTFQIIYAPYTFTEESIASAGVQKTASDTIDADHQQLFPLFGDAEFAGKSVKFTHL